MPEISRIKGVRSILSNDLLSEIIVQVAIIDAKRDHAGLECRAAARACDEFDDREHYRVDVGSKEDRLFISKP